MDDPKDKAGTDLATSPAARTGTAEKGADLAKTLDGDGFAGKLDALFQRAFAGTRMGNDTELWNMVHAFKEDVKTLHDQV